MLFGVGCDLCEVARMEKSLFGAHGAAFEARVFGTGERQALALAFPYDDVITAGTAGLGTRSRGIVVNAAGYRAQEVGRMFGREVPMMVMSHQYILFEEIPELAAWSKEAGRKLPLLRDVDTSYYLRQEKAGMNLGPYERNCRAH